MENKKIISGYSYFLLQLFLLIFIPIINAFIIRPFRT
ncbi:hypothetical protein Xmau_00480 [Xenorhabdus mauleonii]|uniref:Uncharacterized protein n=1 Tax=Xenorhabdus mauleonii TaxID=351675 RepID=A0A1I3J3J2_9GAMM|nr:hypothetical protein Xmau_00480 [Xenorhabdus mauleonii]SFI54841.1 hypothetical protein SAMN05421680_10275 [Xenorhabdus mauleonii]